MKAGPTGALFGSVTPTDIAEELWRTEKVRVDRRKIDLDVIKRIGRYSVPVHVFEGVVAEVKTLVVPEGGELPPEEELAAMEAAEAAEAEAEAEAHAPVPSEYLEELLDAAEDEPCAEEELEGAPDGARRGRGRRSTTSATPTPSARARLSPCARHRGPARGSECARRPFRPLGLARRARPVGPRLPQTCPQGCARQAELLARERTIPRW